MRYNIVHLCSAGLASGAGKGALNLHFELLKQGYQSKFLTLNDRQDLSKEIFSTEKSLIGKVRRKLVTFLDRLPLFRYPNRRKQIFSLGLFGQPLSHYDLIKQADIIHIHWINHGFLSIEEIARLKKPIVWTLRDMWAFTGGCHYTMQCKNFEQECGKCPVLSSNDSSDLSSSVLLKKKKTIDVSKIRWVALSNWLKVEAEKSMFLRKQKINVIPSGIDDHIFSNIDKNLARKHFNLPIDEKLILIGAQNMGDPYKGLSYVLDALEMLETKVTIVVFGKSSLETTLHHKVINLGFIANDYEMAKLYSASDVFVGASIAEAFGKTIAEAQFCGLPAVSFSDTGPADIIEHTKTGYLAKFLNVEDLFKGIKFCLEANWNHHYISERAKSHFAISEITDHYIFIYNEVSNNA